MAAVTTGTTIGLPFGRPLTVVPHGLLADLRP